MPRAAQPGPAAGRRGGRRAGARAAGRERPGGWARACGSARAGPGSRRPPCPAFPRCPLPVAHRAPSPLAARALMSRTCAGAHWAGGSRSGIRLRASRSPVTQATGQASAAGCSESGVPPARSLLAHSRPAFPSGFSLGGGNPASCPRPSRPRSNHPVLHTPPRHSHKPQQTGSESELLGNQLACLSPLHCLPQLGELEAESQRPPAHCFL